MVSVMGDIRSVDSNAGGYKTSEIRKIYFYSTLMLGDTNFVCLYVTNYMLYIK